jgi:hypothetical protein
MNINSNQLNLYRVQMNTNVAKAYQTQNVSQSRQDEQNVDQFTVSTEGKARSMAIRGMRRENAQEMKASMEAFSSAFKELEIASYDTETMTEDEIATVLQNFEDALGDLKPDHMKASADMSSSERVDALKNLQTIGEDMQSGKAKPMGYGPPKGNRPPMKPQDQLQDINSVTETSGDTLDLLKALLESKEEEEEELTKTSSSFANSSIQEILNQLSKSLTS